MTSLQDIVNEAYESILRTPDGLLIKDIKCLVVDDYTLKYLTLTRTKDRLSRDELSTVVKVEKVGNFEYAPDVVAVVYVQPKDESVKSLCENLSRRLASFKEMHIIFTNEPTDEQLKKLAEADRHGVVQSVRTFYAEFYPLSKNLGVAADGSVDQLGDFIKKNNVRPFAIYYPQNSETARNFANELDKDLLARKF